MPHKVAPELPGKKKQKHKSKHRGGGEVKRIGFVCGGETKKVDTQEKSGYICGEEKTRRKKEKEKKDIEGHACIDSSKLFFENSTFCCEQKFPHYFLPQMSHILQLVTYLLFLILIFALGYVKERSTKEWDGEHWLSVQYSIFQEMSIFILTHEPTVIYLIWISLDPTQLIY